MLTVYHNPRCRKSRAGLEYVKASGVEFVQRNYLIDRLKPGELQKLIMKLKIRPEDLIRKQEELYRKELKGKNFTDEEWILIMTESPFLIRRPIVEGPLRAVIGDPPEQIAALL